MCNNLMVKSGRIVECKQCNECIKIDSWRWTQRIRIESFNIKTWFCTFTYKGDTEVGYKEIQKMFKRLRKKYSFRYLCVSERGEKNDRLHYHAVIHGDLTRRQVEGEWIHGFSNAKLTSSNHSARYIAKYMSKTKAAIGGKFYRASIGYGTKDIHKNLAENSIVNAVMERFPDARVVRVNDIKIPYNYQFKNTPEQKQKNKQQNALRRDGT